MEILLIILSVVLFFATVACFLWAVVVTTFGYKVLQSNFSLQNRMNEYKEFFDLMTSTLLHETGFLRSELVRKLSLVPETQEFHKQIAEFETRVMSIRQIMEQEKLI